MAENLRVLWCLRLSILAVLWHASDAGIAGSGIYTMCAEFSQFPSNTVISVGSNVCFLCDYPDLDTETWTPSCSSDMDNMCTCTTTFYANGSTELCFTNFNSDCSGTYQCNADLELSEVTCTAEADLVTTDEVFTEHPASVSAVNGNSVSFQCSLLSGNTSVVWERKNANGSMFIDSSTPPGNYTFGPPTMLVIQDVQPGHAGQYRCALPVGDLFLYSNPATLTYLGEGVTLSLEQTSYSLEEGNNLTVCVSANGTISQNYTFSFSVFTSDGTATSLDYQPVNFTRNIGAIQYPPCLESITIMTVQDSLVEENETLSISLTSNSFIVSISNSTAEITILNDDFVTLNLPTTRTVLDEGHILSLCVSLQGQLSDTNATFSVYTTDGTATDSGADYDPVNVSYIITPTNSEGMCTIVISNDDSIPEPEQCFSLNLQSTDSKVIIGNSVTPICIEDNDNVTVQFLSANFVFYENSVVDVGIIYDIQPENLTLRYNVTESSQTAISGVDYIAQNITVIVNGLSYQYNISIESDSVVEGNETFTLQLSSSDPRVILNTPTITITIIDDDKRVDIYPEQTTYIFSEDDGTVDICLITSDEITYNFPVPLRTSVDFPELHPATVGIDFSSNVFFITLAAGHTTICTNGTLLEDSLVEGTESFYLDFISNDPNIILNSNSEQTTSVTQVQVFIRDSTVFRLNFVSSLYVVSEIAGSQEVCANLTDDTVQIVSGITIDVYITEESDDSLDGVAFNLPTSPLSFSSIINEACVNISVINDPTGHGNRQTTLGLRSGDSEYTVSSNGATIIFTDTQEGITCGELFCYNGGQCLDDSVCVCPSDYTGSECNTRIFSEPTMMIDSLTPSLGDSYTATCTLTVDSEINLKDISNDIIIQWTRQNVELDDDVIIGNLTFLNNTANSSLAISSLTTSDAGTYVCTALLVIDEETITLQQSINLTFVLPAPVLVTLFQIPQGVIAASGSLSLTCSSIPSSNIDTTFESVFQWMIGDGEDFPSTSRFNISSGVTTSTSILTIRPALSGDTNSYTCRVYLLPTGEFSDYLSSSSANSISDQVTVTASDVTLSLVTEAERVPNVPPYNTFELTCSADDTEYSSSLSFEFRWVRETGPEQEQTVLPDSQTMIVISDTAPISVLTLTRTTAEQYVFYCEITYSYEDTTVTSGTSNYEDVTVTGPSTPTVPENVTIFGVGADFAIIQWAVFRVEYTPETYYVEYALFSDSEDSDPNIVRVQYPEINDNFSLINIKYIYIVEGLSPGKLYGFKVVAMNSVGNTSTSEYVYGDTTDSDPFIVLNEDSFTYPIGAAINLEYQVNDMFLGEGGFDTTTYMFIPETHEPLQQPSIAMETSTTVSVQYSLASPSLSGAYVLCSDRATPYYCGGKTSLSIEIPSLTISTELLVSQYVNGSEVNNMNPELVCMPSDTRAAVQWFTIPVYINLTQKYNASFSPRNLNHTLRFNSTYNELPQGTLRVVCDLINVDNPGVDISPVTATVAFIQNPVALLNNDREMEPNAVINEFSSLDDADFLSLVCLGTIGNSQLQWERVSVDGDTMVLVNSETVTIEYFSDDIRETSLSIQPLTSESLGYDYICRSIESGQEASVLITNEDPYVGFTSPNSYSIPIGARVEISARYAYSSNGVENSGAGFTYSLVFRNNSNPLREYAISSGSLNQSSNNFVYAVYGNRSNNGSYILTFTHSGTQQIYQRTTSIVATVPYIAYYEPEVVGRLQHNITLTCLPSDLRAPILWEIQGILLHDYPDNFVFEPPNLRHRAIAIVLTNGEINCGLMNGNDDRNLVNPVSTTLISQNEIIQLKHTDSDLVIYNNTVINLFGDDGFTTAPPIESKRQVDLSSSLYIDCLASQGYHYPFWTTSNQLVNEGSTQDYDTEILSNYVARLSFESFFSGYEGMYTCQSNISSEYVEIFITSRNPYVSAVSENFIAIVEGSPLTLEFRVAINSDGNTWKDENIGFTFSPGEEEGEESAVMFSMCQANTPHNYCYTLTSVSRSDEGIYTASTTLDESEDVTSDSITVDVIRRCPVEVNSGIQWPDTLETTTVSRPCREAGSMFRAGPRATRMCNGEGKWEESDLTSCTIAEIEDPFILVWFVIDADEYSNDQEQSFINSMEAVLDLNGVKYSQVTLKSVYIASVAVTFQVDLVEEEQTDTISQLSSFVRDPENFTSFANYSVMEEGRGSVDVAVADTCRCSSANLGSSLQLCSGAGLSPCNCAEGSCRCQSPFVGDGNSCTLDSDSDGFPDEQLNSPICNENPTLPYCNADICPTITNPDQNPSACEPTAPDSGFNGCLYGPDDVWGIIWPTTAPGTTNTQPCPGGVDTLGNATRVCNDDGNWGNINVLLCQSLAIVLVVEEAAERLPGADEEIEEVTPELLESVAVVSQQLLMATDSTEETGLLPLDLQATNDVVAQVLNVLESSAETGVENVPSQDLVDVFNNVLNETNEEGWTQLQTVGAGSQTLLQNAERYGNYLATTVNDTDQPLMLTRENIVLAAELVDTEDVSDIVFPVRPEQLGNFSLSQSTQLAQITIPGDSLARLSSGENNNLTGFSVVYIIFRNIESFLPINTTDLNNSRAESLVLSSQLNAVGDIKIPYDLFTENPITLNFSFEASNDVIEVYTGVFWNFSFPVGRGGWSSDGIQVISNETRNNVTTVVCNSTHLTSFAVLVDVAGEVSDASEEEQLALQIVSYIGCIISSICLSLTVVFYLSMGKRLFTAVHYFVHLNLSISLLLGYIVFMLGIELGTSTQGGCGFVAALLQYLFLSAFCWMMCEGIMLYLMLIVVFSKLSKKWWFFFLLGYCTPLLFVVIGLASRARYYGVRGDDGELAFCWLSTEKGTIFAFVVPMIVIILINIVFLVLALGALYRSQKQKQKGTEKKSSKKASSLLKATVILLPLLGVTWLFGLLTLNNNATVFAWLFTIFNSFQGSAIFFFHVIRSKTVWSKISPRVSRIKESVFKSSKYQISKSISSYETSDTQSSTGTMRTFLRKKPLQNEYELSTPGPSSVSQEPPSSVVDVENGTSKVTDDEKLLNEETSEKDNLSKAEPTSGEVITNPSTTTTTSTTPASKDSSDNKEVIDDKDVVTKL